METDERILSACKMARRLYVLANSRMNNFSVEPIDVEEVEQVSRGLQEVYDDQETSGRGDVYDQLRIMDTRVALEGLAKYIVQGEEAGLGDFMAVANEFANNPDRYVCLVDA